MKYKSHDFSRKFERNAVSVSTICDEYCSCTQIMGKGVANGPTIPMNSKPPDLTEKLSLYCRFSGLSLTVIYLTKVTSDNQWNSRLVLIKATHSGGWEEGGRDEVWDRECSQLSKRSHIAVVSGY